MRRRKPDIPVTTDPRRAGGSIVGPGLNPGSHREKDSVTVDMTNAVLLSDLTVAMVEPYKDGAKLPPAYAISLMGRINKTTERSEVLYLTNADGAANICAEVIALAGRMGDDAAAEFMAALDQKIAALAAQDAL